MNSLVFHLASSIVMSTFIKTGEMKEQLTVYSLVLEKKKHFYYIPRGEVELWTNPSKPLCIFSVHFRGEK